MKYSKELMRQTCSEAVKGVKGVLLGTNCHKPDFSSKVSLLY